MYSDHVKDHFRKMRRAGRSLGELCEQFGISKGTASLWAKDIEITMQGRQRLQKKISEDRAANGRADGDRRRKKRQEQESRGYNDGLASCPTIRDSMCVGLYWGDGARSLGAWKFSNTDRNAVIELVKWVRRTGYNGDFAAVINAYDDSEYSNEEISEFWKQAGIERITVINLPSKCDPKKRGKHPFGTCHVRSSEQRVYLFNYYLGQREKLLTIAGD